MRLASTMTAYLVQCLLHFLELFRRQLSWVQAYNFASKVFELGSIGRGREGKGKEFNGHGDRLEIRRQ